MLRSPTFPKLARLLLTAHEPLLSASASASRKMSTSSYSAIVIGSGQGGGPLAIALAKAGRKTALIEESHIGGTCVNEGCTPTKTMVASARVAYLSKRSKDYGVEVDGNPSVNMETVRRRKRDIVDSFRSGNQNRIESTKGLDLFMGKAKFVGMKELEIAIKDSSEKKVISGDTIVINTGCRPDHPKICGIDQVPVLDSTSIMELDIIPDHLVIIGGGYVGLEFAQMFRRFGAKVTIIQRAGQLLPREDADIADAAKQILIEDGIEVLLNSSAKSISKIPNSGMSMEIPISDGSSRTITASHILSAAGRKPNTDYLTPSTTGVITFGPKPGFIKTNDQLETNMAGIYAIGDVKGGPAFTHISYDDFRILRNNLITKPSPSADALSTKRRLVPYTVFIDPQLGRIGLSESEAREAGRRIKVAKMPMAYVARALEMNESRGVMKAIVDAETKEILGCAILGLEGGEIMSMIQIAMMGGLTYDRLENAVFAHPCLSEALNNLWGFLD
jgi:pyruvate/2-oxoglutarate dehydrogenase complex dihydrolipoamide dehydrogenase (E3) component